MFYLISVDSSWPSTCRFGTVFRLYYLLHYEKNICWSWQNSFFLSPGETEKKKNREWWENLPPLSWQCPTKTFSVAYCLLFMLERQIGGDSCSPSKHLWWRRDTKVTDSLRSGCHPQAVIIIQEPHFLLVTLGAHGGKHMLISPRLPLGQKNNIAERIRPVEPLILLNLFSRCLHQSWPNAEWRAEDVSAVHVQNLLTWKWPTWTLNWVLLFQQTPCVLIWF